ncbi:reverse transcriptase domain-containing protein [Tanacetum coccineum]
MMAFPFTLKGKAKQWMRRLPIGSISTWDLFKNSFLEEYRPPFKIIKQIEAIRRSDVETRQKLDFKGPIPRMTPSKGIEAIKEISRHSFSWHDEYSTKNNVERGVDELKVVFEQIEDFEHSMKFVTEEVRMAQHRFDTPIEGITNVGKILNKFIKESLKKQKYSEILIGGIKKKINQVLRRKRPLSRNLKFS